VIEPLGLAGQTTAVPLVVGQDVQHGLTLIGETLIGLVQVGHDVEHRAALLVAFSEAELQRLDLRAKLVLVPHARPAIRDRRFTISDQRLWHRGQILAGLCLPTSFCSPSSSFSRAIIFSSRPTTTSSNFSRSRIFSCNSRLDFSRS